MVLEHNAKVQHDCCKTCKYVMGGDSSHRQLHCGLSYYQTPAAVRRVNKLESYPLVFPENVCTHWDGK
jgi:hypothetical protein